MPFKTSAAAAAAPPLASLASEEGVRAQHDPDYRWLVSDIAALDTVREQKSVSLNLKARREERTRIDKERLERENSRRVAKNQPVFKNVEELDKAKDTADVDARPGGADHGGHGDRRARRARAEDRGARRRSKPAGVRGRHGRALASAQQDPEQVPGVLGEHVGQAARVRPERGGLPARPLPRAPVESVTGEPSLSVR